MLAPSEPPEVSSTVSPSGPNTSEKLPSSASPRCSVTVAPGSSRSSTPRNACHETSGS